jgi:hypothetical protein
VLFPLVSNNLQHKRKERIKLLERKGFAVTAVCGDFTIPCLPSCLERNLERVSAAHLVAGATGHLTHTTAADTTDLLVFICLLPVLSDP